MLGVHVRERDSIGKNGAGSKDPNRTTLVRPKISSRRLRRKFLDALIPPHRSQIVFASIARDVRIAPRSLIKGPGFYSVVVLTLAIAIWANTAIFSGGDGVLLRPIPYPDADRLITVVTHTLPAPGRTGDLPYSDRGFWHFGENNRSFEHFGGYAGGTGQQWALTGEGTPVQVDVGAMTLGAFEAIGTLPEHGRLPTAEEDINEGPAVVLIGSARADTRYPEPRGATRLRPTHYRRAPAR
jgi:hypothetical protein